MTVAEPKGRSSILGDNGQEINCTKRRSTSDRTTLPQNLTIKDEQESQSRFDSGGVIPTVVEKDCVT